MKVVILAGGLGTRISEESHLKPKPMIEIGEMPILWHIMKGYSYYGFNDFVICAGYKQHVIKEWFANYFINTCDVTFDYSNSINNFTVHNSSVEQWKVTIVNTGLHTQTAGRIKRIKDYVGNDCFMVTYGDAVGDIDIKKLLDFHIKHGKIGTMSMYNFGQSKGVVEVNKNGIIETFREKSDMDGDLINIGFMVFNKEVFDYLGENSDKIPFEKEPLFRLAHDHELMGYAHEGFWQCMDTLREKEKLEALWNSGEAPWKIWK